ncbi:hypothetical protein PO909_025614 [Leuciscus waleckii]
MQISTWNANALVTSNTKHQNTSQVSAFRRVWKTRLSLHWIYIRRRRTRFEDKKDVSSRALPSSSSSLKCETSLASPAAQGLALLCMPRVDERHGRAQAWKADKGSRRSTSSPNSLFTDCQSPAGARVKEYDCWRLKKLCLCEVLRFNKSSHNSNVRTMGKIIAGMCGRETEQPVRLFGAELYRAHGPSRGIARVMHIQKPRESAVSSVPQLELHCNPQQPRTHRTQKNTLAFCSVNKPGFPRQASVNNGDGSRDKNHTALQCC